MAKNLLEKINEKQLNPNIPEFRVGDTVIVGCKITEIKGGNEKERIQNFEGIVIARKGRGVTETFTVRKESSGVGVTRIFPIHSPNIASIKVTKKGKVRRAKLKHIFETSKGNYSIKERR